jgi:hypothetical protein
MRANVMHPNRCMCTSTWDMSTSIWDTKLQSGGGRGLGYMLFIAHLCNHILRQSGGGTWGTALYTVRGVGSGSRDVDVWTQTSLYTEDRGSHQFFYKIFSLNLQDKSIQFVVIG